MNDCIVIYVIFVLVGYVLDLIESSLFDISATMSLSYHLGMFGDFSPLQKMIK